MRAEFSEFTYGFSLVSELSRALGCRTVPVFPSLIEEGRDNGGYDVNMSMGAVPLYLQFKLSEHLKTNAAKEAKHPGRKIHAPYRRFHITSAARSNQHAMLLGLGLQHEHVYYVAPNFYQTVALNAQWQRGYIADASVFVQPTEIGPILDDQRHAVCFNNISLALGRCYLFSDPKPVKPESREALMASVANSLDAVDQPLKELLPEWSEQLDAAAREGRRIHREQAEAIEKLREERRLAQLEKDGTDPNFDELTIAYRLPPSSVIETVEDPRFPAFSAAQSETTPLEPTAPPLPANPALRQLVALGRRASTEFYSQLFVVQKNND